MKIYKNKIAQELDEKSTSFAGTAELIISVEDMKPEESFQSLFERLTKVYDDYNLLGIRFHSVNFSLIINPEPDKEPEMKSFDEVLQAIKDDVLQSDAIDRRDFSRLADFFPVSEWKVLGFEPKEGKEIPAQKEWTRNKILEELKSDLNFAFQKALDQRGLSASCMNAVIKMWLWILNDELSEDDDYPQYGLPLLKKVAVKYGFENPIGEDYGNESEYSSEEYT